MKKQIIYTKTMEEAKYDEKHENIATVFSNIFLYMFAHTRLNQRTVECLRFALNNLS